MLSLPRNLSATRLSTSPHDDATSVHSSLQRHLAAEPLKLPGGDTTRGVYTHLQPKPRTRLLSFSQFLDQRRPLSASDMMVPGGFRRDYLVLKAQRESRTVRFFTNNFIEFLEMYGNFAGEDLGEAEEDSTDAESQAVVDEETPLRGHAPVKTSDLKSSLLIFKALVGSGVLFMPRAFYNGGLLFSTITLFAFGMITFFCYYVQVRVKTNSNQKLFGDMGTHMFGPWARYLVLFSIVSAQIGFVGTYFAFTAANLAAFSKNVLALNILYGWWTAIFCAGLVPLLLIRNIAKLGFPLLLSLVFIILGLGIILANTTGELVLKGISPTIVLFNSKSWLMFIGVASLAFEGASLIIPIQLSMQNPHHFTPVLFCTMLAITVLFMYIGFSGYGAYGLDTQTIIILNLPQERVSVQCIQVLYAMAVFLTAPLQLFPVLRLAENAIFQKSGRSLPKVKWSKNALRTAICIAVAVLSYTGASNLDLFASVVGVLSCIPLVYIYPPALYLKNVWDDGSVRAREHRAVVIGASVVLFLGVSVFLYSLGDLWGQ